MIAYKEIVLASIAAIGFVLAVWHSTTNALRHSDPSAAALVNPWNVEARVVALSRAISSGFGETQQALLEARAVLGIAPADARAYSLLGEANLRQGRQQEAETAFELAGKLARTEYLMLVRTIQLEGQSGADAQTLAKIEALLRRWPERARKAGPLVTAIIADTALHADVNALIQRSPRIGRRLIGLLLADSRGLSLAYQIAVSLRQQGNPLPDDTLEQIIRTLFMKGETRAAFSLFRASLTKADHQLAGYVFDADFDRLPKNRFFDWQMQTSASAEVIWQERGNDAHILIRFLGKPVKSVGLSQLVVLPPGRYELSTDYEAHHLRAPKGLFWRLRCHDSGREVARIPLDGSKARRHNAVVSFEVEDDFCSAFQLALLTDLLAESFRYRYEGMLKINSVRIVQIP